VSRRGRGWIAATLDLPAAAEDEAVAAFWDAGCLGAQARAAARRAGHPRVRLEAWFSGRSSLDAVRRRVQTCLARAGLQPAPCPRCRRVPDRHWVEVWQRTLRPMRIGRRILAVPEGCRAPARTGRLVLTIPFGQAFGTGEHASTRLALRLLERVLRPGDRVVDLGTGTAILAAASAAMGAGPVLAIDSDPVAVRVARETLRRNGLARRVALRCADAAEALAAGPFDLALVNIGATVIARILPDLAAALAPGGRAVLAGILVGDEASLRAAAGALGLAPAGVLRARPWSALLLRRSARA
jgi:ribosomal protein L11 methyltransferase